jgi:hypothetical protein
MRREIFRRPAAKTDCGMHASIEQLEVALVIEIDLSARAFVSLFTPWLSAKASSPPNILGRKKCGPSRLWVDL